MRLKKQKVTLVERGRIVRIVVRGFGHPESRCQLDQQNVTWCRGHVSETSEKGKALLVADALADRTTRAFPNDTRFYAIDSQEGAALAAKMPVAGAGQNISITVRR